MKFLFSDTCAAFAYFSFSGSRGKPLEWSDFPSSVSESPIWDDAARGEVTKTKMADYDMNKKRSQLLVPGKS